MKKIGGIMPALLTPINEDHQVDIENLHGLVEYVIRQGAEGIYANGSTSEGFLFGPDDRKSILTAVAKANRGRVPLVAQVGGLDAEEGIRLARLSEDLGYDAVSAVTPFYYSFTFEEVMAYYRRLAEVGVPLIVYLIPHLTGSDLALDQIARLLEIPGVVGLKYSAADLFLFERLRTRFTDKTLLFGFDELLFAGVFLGADGAVGSTYNLTAALARGIRDAVLGGRVTEARSLQSTLNGVIELALRYGLYPFLKAVLTELGVPAGVARAPFSALSPEGWESAAAVAAELRLVGGSG